IALIQSKKWFRVVNNYICYKTSNVKNISVIFVFVDNTFKIHVRIVKDFGNKFRCGVRLLMKDITKLLNNRSNVRNISIIGLANATTDTLTDCLLSTSGISVADNFPPYAPWVERNPTEITVEPVCVSLFAAMGDKREDPSNQYVINVIRSDNSNGMHEIRIADGAIIVVDCNENINADMQTLIHNVLNEKLKLIVFINNVDVNLLTVSKSHLQCIYFDIVKIVQEIICLTQQNASSELCFIDVLKNVVFGCVKDGWAFNLHSFSEMYSKSGSKFDTENMAEKLWDHFYSFTEKKWTKSRRDDSYKPSFVQFILEPIHKLYEEIANNNRTEIEKILLKLNIQLSDHEKEKSGESLRRKIMSKWCPVSDNILPLVLTHLPSPIDAQKYRFDVIYKGHDDELIDAIRNCQENGKIFMQISKTINTNDRCGTYAFGRIFSGKLSKGDKVRIVTAQETFCKKNVDKIQFVCGRYIDEITETFSGTICALSGNGPSGITLSYMLSGHWPYWDPEKIKYHPDELLRARLSYADHTKSLVEQELMILADGLEGRCTNPVSLLLDSLQNPCADLGMDLPSMLRYEYKPENQIDHIVLGKGPPGGSWHRMDPNLRTLSLAAWMSLPDLDFGTWESMNSDVSENDKSSMPEAAQQSLSNNSKKSKTLANSCAKCQSLRAKNFGKFTQSDDKRLSETTKRNSIAQSQVSRETQSRALVSKVAKYYESYVTHMKLQKYFINDVIVTSIVPIHWKDAKFKGARWIVVGKKMSTGKTFSYCCKNVVLANGVSDLPNRLGLRAESMELPWITHELPQLEKFLDELTPRERSSLKPVIIVGAGLSAADCVTKCRSLKIPVIHVYRNRTAGLDKMLPEKVYPEYHSVHKMMKGKSGMYEYYMPLPEHTIIDVSTQGDHLVTVQHLKTGETKQIEVSFCTILIGSRPDLRLLSNISMRNSCDAFRDDYPLGENEKVASRQIHWLKNLSEKCRHLNLCKWGHQKEYKSVCSQKWINCKNTQFEIGSTVKEMNVAKDKSIGLGEDPTQPVNCKSNPIYINKFTNEALRAPKGLYCVGPLVGDNFVRFIPGGALAITNAITAAKYQEND
ncbi:Eukaryotic translation elongation factor 2, partial [Pseudolycoriella hygida]